MQSSKVIELRNKLAEKQGFVAQVWELAGPDNDFARKAVLDHLGVTDSQAAVDKVRELDKELGDIVDELKPLAEMETVRERHAMLAAAFGKPAGTIVQDHLHADPSRVPAADLRGLGDAIVESPSFQAHLKGEGKPEGDIPGFGLRELRATLLQTGTGISPEVTRSGRLVEAATRPIEVLDIIPSGTTNQVAVKYLEEVLRTSNAAEMLEGGTYGEDAYKWVDRMDAVEKVGTSLPVTDEQFEDVPGLASFLNSRMVFGIRQRLDQQVLLGNGTPPNISGILDRAGIQTQAKGADPVPDAIMKAITKVRVVGRTEPNYVIINPYDWQDVRLLRTADGIYIWGNPSEAGPLRIWGLPVVVASVLTQNTGLVGDFMFSQLLERRGPDVQMGYSGTQFVEGKRTIRADIRAAFCVYRAAAFCTVTSI